MAYVACTNEDCPEHGVPKDNLAEAEPVDIICGGCGGPVEASEARS